MDSIRLSYADLGVSAWTWWKLRDVDTNFGDGNRYAHRWLLIANFSPRYEFVHAVPRTTKPSSSGYPHDPHKHLDEICALDKEGWILTTCATGLDPICLDHGRFSCDEPHDSVVADVQRALP